MKIADIVDIASPHSQRMTRKGGTLVHQKTLILTRGSMLYSHWMPGVPKSGSHLNIPGKERDLLKAA